MTDGEHSQSSEEQVMSPEHDSSSQEREEAMYPTEIVEIVPKELANEYWEIYDNTFKPLNESSPCRQSFYRDEFLHAMQDPEFKKVISRKDDEVVCMGIFGSGLDKFPWISKEYFEKEYPNEFKEKKLFYFVALLTVPEKQNAGNSRSVLNAMIKYIVDREGVALMDVCKANEWLPKAIERVGSHYTNPESRLLSTQQYWAIKSNGKKY